MHRRIATVAGIRLLVLMAIAAVMLCIGATAASAGTLQVQEWRVTNDSTNHGNPSLADYPSISGSVVVWDTGGGLGSEALGSVLDPSVASGEGTFYLQGNNEGGWEASTPCVFASGSANTYVWALNFGDGSEIDTWRDTDEGVRTLVPASSGSPYWPVTSGDWVVWSDSSSGGLLAAPWSDSPIESSTLLYNGGIAFSTDVSQSSSGTIAVWGDVEWVGDPLHTRAISYYRNLDYSESSEFPIGRADDLGLEQSNARISGDTVVYQQGLRVGNFWVSDGIWTEDLISEECTRIVDATGSPVNPDISGDWVVWESGSPGQTRIYAKNIATGVTGPVSPVGVSAQGPRIDGTTVVWVDRRDQSSTGGTSEIYAAELSEAVDTTPPVTTASGWDQGNHYPGPVTVTLTATDTAGAEGEPVSGVASTWYSIDDPTPDVPTPYWEPFWVIGNGDHTVYFYSVDNAGNIEVAKTATVLIDPAAPSVDLPSPDAPMGSPERDLYETQPLSSDPALAEANSSMMGDSTIRFSVPGTTSASQVTVMWANVPGPVEPNLGAASWTLAAKQFDAVSQEFTTQIKCTEAGLHAVWIHAETPAGASDVIRYYFVKYLSSGLQQPVNPDCSSVFNGSSTIPLKVKILDANGQPVTDIDPTLTVLALHSGSAGSVVENPPSVVAYVDPDDFKYTGNGVWQLNWSAKKSLAKVIPSSWNSATIRFSVSFTHSPKTVTSTDASLIKVRW